MGNKYEVYGWRQVGHNPDRYQDVEVYRGESMLKALFHAWREKRRSPYVKVEWR